MKKLSILYLTTVILSTYSSNYSMASKNTSPPTQTPMTCELAENFLTHCTVDDEGSARSRIPIRSSAGTVVANTACQEAWEKLQSEACQAYRTNNELKRSSQSLSNPGGPITSSKPSTSGE